jgi:uncharacterized Zn finger protein (UPF0148 family)
MTLASPTCPSCGTALVLTHQGDFDSWVCPTGHGLAITVTEAYERLEEDEISQLWKKARAATPTGSARKSPTTGQPMVSVEVTWDADEVPEGESGDGPDEGSVWLDIDVEDQVIWFDSAELDNFPQDRPDPEPSQAELDGVEKIRQAFGQSIVDDEHARESRCLTERIYQRIGRHPGLTHTLTEVGSLGRQG